MCLTRALIHRWQTCDVPGSALSAQVIEAVCVCVCAKNFTFIPEQPENGEEYRLAPPTAPPPKGQCWKSLKFLNEACCLLASALYLGY